MTRPVKMWAASEDIFMRELYARGLSWDDIALRFRVSRASAQAHGHRIGLSTRSPLETLRPAASAPAPEVPLRGPLPAGHPTSWGAVVDGTLLDGVPWTGLERVRRW